MSKQQSQQSRMRKCIAKNNIEEILAERQAAYGGFDNVSKTSQLFKNVLHNMPEWNNFPSYLKEACEMIVHKISRAGNGNYMLLDTWRDIEGYSKLAADLVEQAEEKK